MDIITVELRVLIILPLLYFLTYATNVLAFLWCKELKVTVKANENC